MAEPTPRPWRYAPGDFIRDAEGDRIASTGLALRTNGENAANAALIVRAVNAHDDLVAALKTIRDHHWSYAEARDLARAALAKAGAT